MSTNIATHSDQYDLRFTGNWYTDLGILGFIKVMEYFYGWDLGELKERLKKFKDQLFYFYFSPAYISFYLEKLLRGRSSKKNKEKFSLEKFESVKQEIRDKIIKHDISSFNKEQAFNTVWREYIKDLVDVFLKEYRKQRGKSNSIESEDIKVPMRSDYFHNFLMFNPSKQKYKDIKKTFKNILEKNLQEEKILGKFDRTINKFLASEEKSRNIFYTPTNAENIYRLLKIYPVVFLICFEAAFEKYGRAGWYAFYSPELEFTYYVNKKLQLLKYRVGSKGILKLTWQAIVDSLYERHAKWVLEDMYIVRYKGIQKQRIIDVEYIGLDKVRASLILDDKIRDSLNIRINIGEERELREIWLLEEFLRGSDLYSIILNYFRKIVRRNEKIDYPNNLVVALAVEYSLRQKAKERTRGFRLFNQSFFKGYFTTISKIHKYFNDIRRISIPTKEIFEYLYRENREGVRPLISMLLALVEKLDRNSFMNLMLSELNKYPEPLHHGFLRKFYRDIFLNDYWYLYALSLLINLYHGVNL